MITLLCAPRSSLDNPTYQTGRMGQKSFCVISEGDLEGWDGFWVEDDDTMEEGFLSNHEDTFWVHDPNASAWIVRRFQGRTLRKGSPKGGKGKKGKGKGKGSFKGRAFFRPRLLAKGKGKGKSKDGKAKD